MKTMFIGAALAAATAALLPARSASAQVWLTPDLRITSVSASGSECPRQTPTVVYVPPQRALLVNLPGRISAEAGPGRELSESSAFCGLRIGFTARPGHRFAITRAEYHGNANLDSGVLGQQTISHWFAGAGERGRFTADLTGPQRGRYQRNQTAAAVAWSPCNMDRSLYIDFDVSVSNSGNPRAQGTLSTGPGVYLFELTWQACPRGSSDSDADPDPGAALDPGADAGAPGSRP